MEEVIAVNKGKNLRDFRREKEEKQRGKTKITQKLAAKEEIKEKKN